METSVLQTWYIPSTIPHWDEKLRKTLLDACYLHNNYRRLEASSIARIKHKLKVEECKYIPELLIYTNKIGYRLKHKSFSFLINLFINHPAFRWLCGITNMDIFLAAKICGYIPMVSSSHFITYSKLRKFAGLAPIIDGKTGKRIDILSKTNRSKFNVNLRRSLYSLFLHWERLKDKNNIQLDPEVKTYYSFYLQQKSAAEKKSQNKNWTPIQIRFTAIRKTCDLFLSHLWETWRLALRWPVPDRYVHSVLNKQGKEQAWQYSSKLLSDRIYEIYEGMVNKFQQDKFFKTKLLFEINNYWRNLSKIYPDLEYISKHNYSNRNQNRYK